MNKTETEKLQNLNIHPSELLQTIPKLTLNDIEIQKGFHSILNYRYLIHSLLDPPFYRFSLSKYEFTNMFKRLLTTEIQTYKMSF